MAVMGTFVEGQGLLTVKVGVRRRQYDVTPYKEVHLYFVTASNVSKGSKRQAGYTIVAPCAIAARFPSTIPKQ